MTMERISKGRLGEDAAATFLTKEGYKIVERNFRCPLGEIDIVAVDKGVLVFVEVKTRSSNKFGLPEEAVNRRKQHQMAKTTQFYPVFDLPYHLSSFLSKKGLDSASTKSACQYPVKDSRRAAPLELTQHRYPDIVPDPVLQLFFNLISRHSPFSNHYDAVSPSLFETYVKPLCYSPKVKPDLRDNGYLGPACYGGHGGEIPAVPSHNLNDEGPVMG